MKKDFSCAECKPADMTCQISIECKRQRRLEKLENDEKILSDVTDKLIKKGILKNLPV